MTTITYTTNHDAAVDAAYERALVDARESGSAMTLAHRIDGRLRSVGPLLERRDPCDTSRTISYAHVAGPDEVSEAVSAARRAQREWAATTLAERTRLLRGICGHIERRQMELAAVISAETGKTRVEALAEVTECSALVTTYCDDIERHDGYRTSLSKLTTHETNTSVFRPYGVFAVIAPFNFPSALAWNMVLGALVTGNAAVLKPAHQTPRSGALIGEIAQSAGLPDGLLNVIHGGADTGALLVGSAVDGVAFTGSATVGHQIAQRVRATSPLRPVILEMGGKNPALVTASADLDRAAEGIVRAAFGLSGQKCSACSRVVVAKDVHDDLVARLVERTRALVLGDPADARTSLGPVIETASVQRYDVAVAAAHRDGRVVVGGERGDLAGQYVEPTVVCDLPRGHHLSRQELFVPILTVTSVDDFDEALTECNAVEYGLTAGIFTRDACEQAAFLDRADAGVLYVNRREGATTGAWPGVQAFCGWKRSGGSGMGGLGPHYLYQFMREQSHTVMEEGN